MELVKGVPITEFCDKNNLSVNERMKLFVPVCLAVQHAHHKGIIHRDIKPSNVMVTLHDGNPVPKVIDFGVAKATSQQLTQRTLFTAYGQMIGTPLYMSPEQAEMSGLDIDTRSDIYSLGVLLYELLTGTTPLELKQLREAGFVEMQRLNREVEAPRPSTRLSSMHNEASIICSKRGLDARHLSEFLRGEVDWIVMKAIEKDRQRRYDTPTAFANDIQRFLNNEAIEARPPSTTYRLQKWIQRNRKLAIGAGSVAAALFLGATVSTGLAIYANTQLAGRVQAEHRLQNSLADAQSERTKAVEERDRAVKAEEEQVKLATLAEQRRIESDNAQKAEAEQRAAADQLRTAAEKKRDEAEQLKQETIARNKELQQLTEQQRRTIYASDMNLVRIEAQRGNLQRVREILMNQLPIDGKQDLRGFEWNYWYRYLNQAQVLMKIDPFQYGKPSSAAAVIPGGELVAVTTGDNTEIKEITSGKVLGKISERLRLLVNRTRFSNSGRSVHGEANSNDSLVSPGTKRTLPRGFSVYDSNGDKHAFDYPDGSFSHISFLNLSPDGKWVAALGNAVEHIPEKPSCRAIVWNVDSKEIVLNGVYSREINRIDFSPDGTLLAAYLCKSLNPYSNDFRDVVVAIDISTGKEISVAQHDDEIDSVFWLPDGRRLILGTLSYSGANRKELLSWTIGESRLTRLSQERTPDYIKAAISPDGRLIAITGHTTSNIRLIDTVRGNVVHTFHNEATTIDTVTFSQDGQKVIACSTAGTILSWDLSQSGDLFALRSKPLPRLANDAFTISPDQSRIAVMTRDNNILVRTRDGHETLLTKGVPEARGSRVRLVISPDSHYLTLLPSGVPQSQPSERNQALVEMFDLETGKSIWGKRMPIFPVATAIFAPDSKHVWIRGLPNGIVFKCESGEDVTPGALKIVGRPSLDLSSNQVQHTSRILVAKHDIASAQREWRVLDALSGEQISVIQDELLTFNGSNALSPISSPDGIYVGMSNRSRHTVSVWNTEQKKTVFETNGSSIEFSSDGKRAAAIERTKISIIELGVNTVNGIESISVWDVTSGRQLSTIPLSGDWAQDVRFSPDGSRLLTLHGVTPTGSGGAQPQGRLWDVDSGRELFAMPVAEVNHYNWDLLFDQSGNRLTSINFGKYAGSGSGGDFRVYDATPLSEKEDAQLIAGRLFKLLTAETTIPEEIAQRITAIEGLKPMARELALNSVKLMRLDVDRIAANCFEIVSDPNRTADDYRKALRWAQVLSQADPESFRDRALLGAALYRNGQFAESIATLDSTEPSNTAGKIQADVSWQFLSDSIRLLALHKVGESKRLSEYLEKFIDTYSTDWGGEVINRDQLKFPRNFPPMRLIYEVRNSLFAQSRYLVAEYRIRSPAKYYSDSYIQTALRVFGPNGQALDQNRDGQISLSEAKDRWTQENFDGLDSDHNAMLSQTEYRNGLIAQALLEGADLLARDTSNGSKSSVEAALARLDEALQLAPNYSPLLRAKAWMLATTSNDNLRDATQAMADGNKACVLTKWQEPFSIESLAAAEAEAGKFDDAIQHQEQSLFLQSASGFIRARARLKLYEQRKLIRDTDQPALRTLVHASQSLPEAAVLEASPIVSSAVFSHSRRFAGSTGGSISPDGQKLVLSSSGSSVEKSELQIIELKSGDSKTVFERGVRPFWSPKPDGPIAFLRIREGQPARPSSQEIWVVNADSTNGRKISDGGSISWTQDGTLYFNKINERNRMELRSVHPDDPEKTAKAWFEVDGFPIVSRDGHKIAYAVPGQIVVRSVANGESVANIAFDDADGAGFVTWSPDGRYLCYNAATRPGAWLIEVATGKWRLLTDATVGRAQWSTDGKTISIEIPREIVLLDLSAIDLNRVFEEPNSQEVSSSKSSQSKVAP